CAIEAPPGVTSMRTRAMRGPILIDVGGPAASGGGGALGPGFGAASAMPAIVASAANVIAAARTSALRFSLTRRAEQTLRDVVAKLVLHQLLDDVFGDLALRVVDVLEADAHARRVLFGRARGLRRPHDFAIEAQRLAELGHDQDEHELRAGRQRFRRAD